MSKKVVYFAIFFVVGTIYNAIARNQLKQNFNSPIKIESDQVYLKKGTNTIIFSGNVKAKQDNLYILTDTMHVKYITNEKNKLEIVNIKAIGNVILKNETLLATGDEGEYDIKLGLFTLRKNIILNEKDVVVYGEKMEYNTITEESRMFGEKENKRITIILDNINDLRERYDDDE